MIGLVQPGVAAVLILIGCFFFFAGTVGMLRFPDVLSRLHALTKADNLGLGFVVLGAAVLAGSLTVAVQLLVIWLFVLGASSTVAYLIAGWSKNTLEERE